MVDEDEELAADDSESDGVDPRDHTRPPVRFRLVRALAGTGVVKQGLFEPDFSGPARVSLP